jgi:hypothetical protein
MVLVLNEEASNASATDMLFRRERNQVGSEIIYKHKENPGPDDVVIEQIRDFGSCDIVVYTRIATNIHPLTATKLAELAIASAKKSAGARHRDGITYLIEAKKYGVITALSAAYEAEVLLQTTTDSLEAAWLATRESVEPRN